MVNDEKLADESPSVHKTSTIARRNFMAKIYYVECKIYLFEFIL